MPSPTVSSHAPRLAALAFALALVGAAPASASPDRDAARHYDAGKRAFDDGDMQKAIDELKASLAAKPGSKAHLLLGNAFTKAGQLEDAKREFESFLQADPTSPKRRTVESLIRALEVLAKTKLQVTSTPPGATVYLDLRADGARGKTPLELSATPGLHRLMIDLEGYEQGVANATAVEGKQVPVSIVLKARGCDVTVAGAPAGASVSVDGQPAAPLANPVRVPSGRHELVVTAGGAEGKQSVICGDKPAPLSVSVDLKAGRRALLALEAPEGSRVTVDGAAVTRTGDLPLDPGEHTISVEEDGKAPWRLTTRLRAGERLELAPKLEAGGGATGIEVAADPADATVRVDGKVARAGAALAVSPGDHTVTVRAAGHRPLERRVAILPGERAHLEARLEPRGRTLLWLALGATALAVGAEAVALVGHSRASEQLAGSSSYDRWHDTELGGHIAAGTLAVAAVAGYVGWIVQSRRGGDETPTTRVGALIGPNGGTLVLGRSF